MLALNVRVSAPVGAYPPAPYGTYVAPVGHHGHGHHGHGHFKGKFKGHKGFKHKGFKKGFKKMGKGFKKGFKKWK